MLIITIKNLIKKRVLLLFSSFLFFLNYNGQVIIRNSDYKVFDSISIVQNSTHKVLSKKNFKNFVFENDDKVFYKNNVYDFSVSNDTLFFFDKIKEIESIEFTSVNLLNKREKQVSSKSRKKNNFIGISSLINIASFIRINSRKNIFIKSITIYPHQKMVKDGEKLGSLKIQFLSSTDGFPNSTTPILQFEQNIDNIKYGEKLEIILPKIIKYPTNGFFISLSLNAENRSYILLKMSNDDSAFIKSKNNEWKVDDNVNSFYYTLKILQ